MSSKLSVLPQVTDLLGSAILYAVDDRIVDPTDRSRGILLENLLRTSPAGSLADPAISFLDDQASGLYLAAVGDLRVVSSGSISLGGADLTPIRIGGINDNYHLYVYSAGNPTAPTYTRGIVNHHSGTLTAGNSTLYAASTGWSAIGSGGFAHTGGIYGLSYYAQYDGVGGTNDYLIGGQFGAAAAGTTTTTEMRGVSGYIGVIGSGNQPLGYAFYATTTKGSTGVLSSYHAYYAEGPSSGFGATLAAAFSCPWAAATNRYGLYISGTVQNYIAGVLTAPSSFVRTPATITLTTNAGTLDITKGYSNVTITANSTLTPSAAGANGQTCAVYATNSNGSNSYTLTIDNAGTDYARTIPAGSSVWITYVSNGTDWVPTSTDPASGSAASTSRVQLQNPTTGAYFYDTAANLVTAGLSTTVVNGTTYITLSLTIDALADSMNYGFGFLPANFTITNIRAVHTGSGLSSPSILLKIYYGTDRTSGTAVVTAGNTVTSTTTGSNITSFDSAVAAGFLWLTTGSKSGTTGNFEVYVTGHY